MGKSTANPMGVRRPHLGDGKASDGAREGGWVEGCVVNCGGKGEQLWGLAPQKWDETALTEGIDMQPGRTAGGALAALRSPSPLRGGGWVVTLRAWWLNPRG